MRGLGYARFSKDGSRMAAMAYDRTYEQTLYEVDSRATSARPLRTLRNPSAHWCKLSPKGDWFACSTSGLIEDLVLIRADGGELRKVTSDSHKDRAAAWNFAGDRLAFASSRGGVWGIWSIRTDGSDVQQMPSTTYASIFDWSPDGRQLVASDENELLLIDVAGSGPATVGRRVPIPTEGQSPHVAGWSGRGNLVAITLADKVGALHRLGLLDLITGAFREIAAPIAGAWVGSAAWLPDSRHLIARSVGGVSVIDTQTAQARIIAPAAPTDYLSVSRNGRVLSVEHEVLDSDIWLIELPVSGSSPPR